MKFRSYRESYTYILVWLRNLMGTSSHQVASRINEAMQKIQIELNNHCADPSIVIQELNSLSQSLEKKDIKVIEFIIDALQSKSHYNTQTKEEKFENPLGRRAESELWTLLLLKPTAAMMNAVDQVSQQIILYLFDLLTSKNTELTDHFLTLSVSKHLPATCGAFKTKPTLVQVMGLLQKNDPAFLPEIMHIHFRFAKNLFRKLPLTNVPNRTPVGKFGEIIKNEFSSYEEFLKMIASDHNESYLARAYISDRKMYNSPLYISGNRGRLNDMENISTKQYGLMLSDQEKYAEELPFSKNEAWTPDCLGQEPDFNSPYVTDLIEHGAIYVSGPSGMATLFLGQMEVMANLETVELKQNYLSAVTAYIVGSGFHSLHEVIGPAEYALNLVPGYHVSVPSEKKRAEAPNFQVFFDQQCKIDSEFKDKLEIANKKYLDFFEKTYEPLNADRLDLPWEIPKGTHRMIRLEMKKYILERATINKKDENPVSIKLKFLERRSGNTKLKLQKINLFYSLYKIAKDETTYLGLSNLISGYKEMTAKLKTPNPEKKKSLTFWKTSRLTHISKIEEILENTKFDYEKERNKRLKLKFS